MKLKFTNFAEGTLNVALAIDGTVAEVSNYDQFPQVSVGETFRLTIFDGEQTPEIVEVTGRDGNLFTITRATESTAAKAWAAGAKVRLSLTAEAAESLFARLEVNYCEEVSGTANAIALDSGLNLNTYATGQVFLFTAAADNTGNVTVNVDGLGAIPLRFLDATTELLAGSIVSGYVHIFAIVDEVGVLLQPLSQTSAINTASMKVYGEAELGTLQVLGAAYGISPAADDNSVRFATTEWVLSRIATISVPEVLAFTASVTVPHGSAYQSKLAAGTTNQLLAINATDDVVLGGAATQRILVKTDGDQLFTIGIDGIPSFPSPSDGDDSTKGATTAFVQNAVSGALAGGYAPLDSPELIGTPHSPTATLGTNTTQIATTAFVKAAGDVIAASVTSEASTRASADTTLTNAVATKAPLDGNFGVGSLAFARCGVTVVSGATIAGSSLTKVCLRVYHTGAPIYISASGTLSGTWRNLGATISVDTNYTTAVSLWQRIS